MISSEHKFLRLLLEQRGRGLCVEEESAHVLDVLHGDVGPPADLGRDGGRREQLGGVAQGGLDARLAEDLQGVLVDLEAWKETTLKDMLEKMSVKALYICIERKFVALSTV